MIGSDFIVSNLNQTNVFTPLNLRLFSETTKKKEIIISPKISQLKDANNRLVFVKVNPQGVECKRLCTVLPDVALTELLW